MKAWIPSGPELVREAIIVMGGALLAALVVSQLPGLRQFLRDSWAPPGQQN